MSATRILLVACVATFLTPGRPRAQEPAEFELMFIGDSLFALRLAIDGISKFTPLAVKQPLREQIANPELIVLIAPPLNKTPPDRVVLFRLTDSSPAPFPVEAKELAALRDFRVNPTVKSAQAVTALYVKNQLATAAGMQAIAELVAAVKKEPDARTLVGGVVASGGAQHPELDEYVRDYRAAILDRAKKSLDLKKVKEGTPYSFGPTPVTRAQLAGISQGVGTEMIDGEKFHRVWVGSSLILVKPIAAKEFPKSTPKPDGLHTLKLDPSHAKEIRTGHLAPTIKLEPLPVIK